MKSQYCKKRGIYDIGFIDPYIVNFITIQEHGKDTEANLLRFLKKQNSRTETLFPYNFK